jgi:TonB-linked SusC/RagA family outer membrane protein
MYIRAFLLLFAAGILINSAAQTSNSQYSIKGTVIDSTSNEAMPGVTVLLKYSNKGTVTDVNGSYEFNSSPGEYILIFSFIGYETKEVKIELNRNLSFTTVLSPVIKYIQEIKITGQRKFFGNVEYGRDIPSISTKEIKKLNTNNASDILHARVAGVWATKTSGSPGDHQKIRIRGQASFYSSSEPLYVVDGVPIPIVNMSSLGIADLNLYDIDNVSVLRDASSTALYGFQGGNGVVLIDTKKGGKNEISFSTKFGNQWFDNFYDLMGTKEFLENLKLAKTTVPSNIEKFYPPMSDTIKSDDWQDMVFKNALSKDYQLSLSGSAGKNKSMSYYVSGSYADQDGILPQVNYKRYTAMAHMGKTWKKLAVDLSYRGSVQFNKNNQDLYGGNPLTYNVVANSPCLRSTPDSLIMGNGGPNVRVFSPSDIFNIQNSLEYYLKNYHHKLDIRTHDFSASGRIQLNEHLSLNALASIMLRKSYYDYTQNSFTYKSDEDIILVDHQYNVSYLNNFGNHNVSFVAAYRYYTDNIWWKVDSTTGNQSIAYLRNSMGAYSNNGSVIRSIGSYVGNASYDFRKTFFFSLITNFSRIKEGVYIDYSFLFPSAAFSWDLSRHFPLNQITWINNFSLFTNWGKSGNYPLNGLGNDLYSTTRSFMGDVVTNNTYIRQLANHNLKHESTEETDFGINGIFFNKRLNINFTLYNKNISQLILQREIPEYYGSGMQFTNVGEINVKGKEISITATPVNTDKFLWSFNFNLSQTEQLITKMYDSLSIYILDMFGDMNTPMFRIKKGFKIGDIYGYKTFGRWKATDDKKNKLYINRYGIKYYNPDTSSRDIDINDKVILGNSIPTITWNFSNTFQYKSFSIDMVWYAVLNIQKFNLTRAGTYITGVNREIKSYVEDSIGAIRGGDFYQTTEFCEDASFIRLKTLTLTFAPEKKILQKINYHISLSIENILTITKFKGYDPEATTYTDNNFSDNAFDRGVVPNPKAFYITAGINF